MSAPAVKALVTKPLLRLFNTHGGYDSETFDVIKNTLYCFVKERNKDKTDSLNAKVLELVKKRINDYNQGKPELTFSEVWDYIVKEQLSGKPIDDKPNSMRTSLFGDISKDRVAAIMRGLGGNRDRNSAGDKRIWKFDMKTLDRFSNIYKQIPDNVEIEEPEQQTTLGFAMASVDDISPSDTSDTSDRFGKVDGGSDEK